MSTVTGKVAKVSPDYEVVINRGNENGVTRGQIFRILARGGELIRDPEDPSGEPLGRIRKTRVLVKVVEVSSRLCIARTYRQVQVRKKPINYMNPGIDLFNPPELIWVQETISESKDNDDRGISVGDDVESVLEVSDDAAISRLAIDDAYDAGENSCG